MRKKNWIVIVGEELNEKRLFFVSKNKPFKVGVSKNLVKVTFEKKKNEKKIYAHKRDHSKTN